MDNNTKKEAVMAKARSLHIDPHHLERSDLEQIIGVGARNIGFVHKTVSGIFDEIQNGKLGTDEIPVERFVRKGAVSTDTAENIVAWLHGNVDLDALVIEWEGSEPNTEHRVVSTEEIFEGEQTNGHPLLALAFDPEVTIAQAAEFLTAHEDEAGDLGKRLALVQGWLRGEYLAPAPSTDA